jgi:hypothetical protein
MEGQAKFERDMIELLKSARLNEGSLQTATWTSGDLRQARQPVKRKGTAASAAGTGTASAKPPRQGRKRTLNPDGSIASVSVKKERVE